MDADEPQKNPAANALVWDCGSSLYDSAELKSFRLQLDAALASRCYSMPHLTSDLRQPPPPATAAAPGTQIISRRRFSSRFSRSVQKLLRSVLRLKPASRLRRPDHRQAHQHALYYGVRSDAGVVLASIPEVCEKDLGSPDQQSYSMSSVGKAASERFGNRAAAAVVSLTAMA